MEQEQYHFALQVNRAKNVEIKNNKITSTMLSHASMDLQANPMIKKFNQFKTIFTQFTLTQNNHFVQLCICTKLKNKTFHTSLDNL